jgi:sensor histidine kinase regulating citrate/malate metabolism
MLVLWSYARGSARESVDSLKSMQVENTEEVVTNLRVQRHGFVNHLQVIYGLLQLGKIQKAQDYILSVSSDVLMGGAWPGLARYPELGALLGAKFMLAQAKGIDASCEVSANLDLLPVPPFKLATILGNLLDNAIDALTEYDGAKSIRLLVREAGGFVDFEVWDSGGPIPREVLTHLFQKGFTTKDGKGSGLGLFTSRHLAEELGGTIKVRTSTRGGNSFLVRLPRAGNAATKRGTGACSSTM